MRTRMTMIIWPLPACRGQGKRTVDGSGPVQHRAEHREHLQERGTHLHDRPKYGEELSGNGEDLRAGQEVLRRSEIREQSGQGRPQGAADHPDGGRHHRHLRDQLPRRWMRDDNFTVEELGAIAFGYTKLLEESNDVLTELKNVVNITTLSMTDKERMDVVESCYSKMKRYRNLVSYYTNKNISVSYLRAKKKNDLDRIMGLYGNANERYW